MLFKIQTTEKVWLLISYELIKFENQDHFKYTKYNIIRVIIKSKANFAMPPPANHCYRELLFLDIMLLVILNYHSFSLIRTTVMTLSFRTYRSGQTVQTQIRLLLEEQSDQGLTVCFSICIFLTIYSEVLPLCLNFR